MIDQQPFPGQVVVRPARAYSGSLPSERDAAQAISARRAAVGFLVGVALTACGVILVRSELVFAFLSPEVQSALAAYLDPITHYGSFARTINNPPLLLAGGLLGVIGAIIAGLVARQALPDKLAGLSLSVPSLRLDLLAIGSIGVSVACNALLYWHILSKQYTHWDFLLFLAGLGFAGFAVHRLDRPRRASTLRLSRLDLAIMLGLVVFAAAVNSIELMHWNFAWVGDEGDFFAAAKVIAEGRPESLFNLAGVYGSHPIMDSAIQSLGLRLFGANVIGWRSAEIMVTSVSAALLYLLGTALMGRLPAVVAGVVLAGNNYLMAFARIGYNNTHVVLYATLAMLMLALAWRTRKAVFVFATGAAMGACLYTFMSALLIGPIIAVLLLIIFFRRPTWKQVFAGVLMLLAFALVITPALLTTPPDSYFRTALGNAVARSDVIKDPGWSARVGLVDSVISFWYNEAWRHHYVAGPLVDPIIGVLLAAGLFIALFRIGKRAERLIFIWFVGGLFLVAFTNYYGPAAHLTRLLLIMPAAALLAGLAVSKLDWALTSGLRSGRAESLSETRWGHEPAKGRGTPPVVVVRAGIMALLVLATALNLYQLLVEGPAVLPRYREEMVMKSIQENPGYLIVEVGSSPNPEDGSDVMLDPYPWYRDRFRYASVGDFARLSGEEVTRTPTVYIAFDPKVVEELASKLPVEYKLTPEIFPPGGTMWLFKPMSHL